MQFETNLKPENNGFPLHKTFKFSIYNLYFEAGSWAEWQKLYKIIYI